MRINLHTHTPRCNHACGAEQEYIESAIQSGITTLGFSDHAPYLFDYGYYSSFRMHPEQLRDYVETLQSLRENYRDRIYLPVGVELEYYPKYFDRTVQFLLEHGIEYCLLGQHFTGDEPFSRYSGTETADEAVLEQYVRNCVAGMETGIYTYIAHPDLIHYVGDRKVYRKWMRILIQASRDCSVGLECNLLGLREGRHYPCNDFLALCGEDNCELILGCDAHTPRSLLDSGTEEKAKALLSENGIKLCSNIEIKQLQAQ